MCVILIAEKQVLSEIQVQRAFESNPDGAGIAWLHRNRVQWRKGLELEDAIEVAKTTPLPYIMHFRIATAGGVTPLLTHPFPLSRRVSTALTGNARSVLFHNGHVLSWEDLLENTRGIFKGGKSGFPKDENWSDSRLLAWYAANVPAIFEEMFKSDGKNIAPAHGDKVAVFHADGKIEKRGAWTTVDGIACSNASWNSPSLYRYYRSDWENNLELDEVDYWTSDDKDWKNDSNWKRGDDGVYRFRPRHTSRVFTLCDKCGGDMEANSETIYCPNGKCTTSRAIMIPRCPTCYRPATATTFWIDGKLPFKCTHARCREVRWFYPDKSIVSSEDYRKTLHPSVSLSKLEAINDLESLAPSTPTQLPSQPRSESQFSPATFPSRLPFEARMPLFRIAQILVGIIGSPAERLERITKEMCDWFPDLIHDDGDGKLYMTVDESAVRVFDHPAPTAAPNPAPTPKPDDNSLPTHELGGEAGGA